MHITINDDLTALILDDADSPTLMLRIPAYNLETMKLFASSEEARTQAELYANKAHLFMPYVSPEEEAATVAAIQKADAIRQINQTFEEEVAAIKDGYTEDEIKSWSQQVAEAQAYQADQTAATPLLDAILVNRGGTKDELVLRIAANATQYAQVFGAALGKKQKAIADLG